MKYVGQSRRHALFSLMYLHVSPSLDGKATSQYLVPASQESHWRDLTAAPPLPPQVHLGVSGRQGYLCSNHRLSGLLFMDTRV